ncbi:MAG: substrate-binding periplasmic protein [Candidatus Krumholzibacteriia bacterium]
MTRRTLPEGGLPPVLLVLCLLALAACSGSDDPPPSHAEPLAASPGTPPDSTIILAADAWPPYNCAEDDTNAGYMVDVARAVFEPLGYRVEYRVLPWEESLAGAREGRYDGAIAATTEEGMGLVIPQEPLLYSQVVFFTLAGSDWVFRGPESLADRRLGCIEGYDYVEWLNDYIGRNADNPALVQAESGTFPMRRNILKLVNRSIDVLAGDEGTVRYVAGNLGFADRIRSAGTLPRRSACYIAFTPSSGKGRRLAGILDDGIRRLEEQGRLEDLRRFYRIPAEAAEARPGDR